MQIKKKPIFHNLFYLIIFFMIIFNGGNNNLYIQINFILISSFFLLLINEKNYLARTIFLFEKNKLVFYTFITFLFYLIFQIIPLPLELIKVFSPTKYQYLDSLGFDKFYSSISLNPSNSFFGFLNIFSLFLFLIIFKSLFYKIKHILNFYYFIILIGAISASIAIYFYLIGNPDLFIIKNSFYKNSATGFFINRTVFSCFLVLCFFCGAEYLRLFKKYNKDTSENFFRKIHVRIFILFVTIGIITSFSRIGNFLLISLITFYICYLLLNKKEKDKFFLNTLLLIVIFDILILGYYFGSEKLFARFYFLSSEINEYFPNSESNDLISRGSTALFALQKIKEFSFFGYGLGGFEYLFKIDYPDLSSKYVDHAHSDLPEFIGELGLIGFLNLLLVILLIFIRNNFFQFKNLLLIYFLIILLIFDFSLHIPIIQFLLVILFSINIDNNKKLLNS